MVNVPKNGPTLVPQVGDLAFGAKRDDLAVQALGNPVGGSKGEKETVPFESRVGGGSGGGVSVELDLDAVAALSQGFDKLRASFFVAEGDVSGSASETIQVHEIRPGMIPFGVAAGDLKRGF